jgi:hypothetical protein
MNDCEACGGVGGFNAVDQSGHDVFVDCPECGGPCDLDTVDVPLGEPGGTPFCPRCGWEGCGDYACDECGRPLGEPVDLCDYCDDFGS